MNQMPISKFTNREYHGEAGGHLPMQTRRGFLGGLAGAASGLITRSARGSVVRPTDRKPNLLFVIADDHAGYVLGADGNPRAYTPNLDRLAAQGTRFAANYCNSPVCTPSRQSILTGQLPHAAGVTVLSTPLEESKPTLAKNLDASGYSTAVFGKMHFNRPGIPGLHGFQTACTEDITKARWLQEVGPAAVPEGIRTKPPWKPFQDPARVWLNADKLPFPQFEAGMRSTWTAQHACQFLTEHRTDPFALWVSFQEPHSPFDFPIEDRDRFDPQSFPAPEVGPEDPEQIPLIFRNFSAADKQGIIAAYYTSVAFLDRSVGKVLAHLHELGLDRDTLVIYMSDHGYSLGQHGRFEKHCCYDPALRVPLMMRWPERIARRVVRDFTASVDVGPTILDLLGAERFEVNHGQSLRPYLEGRRVEKPREEIFSEYLENEEACIRTREWKYVHCSGRRARTDGYSTDHPTPGRYVRLYNLKADPGEFHNVADQHPAIMQKLTHDMLAVFRTTHPEGRQEPGDLSSDEALDWYLRPRDARPVA
jgi:choline-sulfatase